MGNALIILGIFIALLGVVLNLITKIRLPLLPGDIFIEKENFAFYFPIVTSLIISLLLTILLNLFRRE